MDDFKWDFSVVFEYQANLFRGLLVTFELSIIIILVAMVGGIIIGAGRFSKNKLFNWPATAYIELFRNTPVLVQIVWFYYAFPVLIGIQMEGFYAALIGIGLNMIAYTADIVRGGIQSIEKGQWEAGKSIGMGYLSVMRRVVLPQALVRMIPPFTNRTIEAVKATSLASTIAVGELLFEGQTLANTVYRPFELYTAVAVLYFLATYPLALFSYWLEARLAIDGGRRL
jgi:polar amino acid transport system permease protein